MALDFDFSAVMQLLATKQAAELRRQELELSRQQAQFDNAMRQEDRNLRIAEHAERMVLLDLNQNQARFDLDLAQSTRDFKFRQEEAQAKREEGALRFAEETEADRKRNIKLEVERNQQLVDEGKRDQAFLGILGPMQQGVLTALGENPSIDTLARVGSSIDRLPNAVQRFIPQKMRSQMKEGGLKGLLRAPIGAVLESRIKAGDIEASSVAMGTSPYSTILSDFISDEARTAARETGNRALGNIGAQITNLPSAKDISDKFHTFGNVDIAIQWIIGVQDSMKASAAQLGNAFFGHEEFFGKRNGLLFQYEEKNLGLERLKEDLGNAAFVVGMGSGILTDSQRRGLDTMARGLVNDTLASVDPVGAVNRLGTFVEATKFYPRAQTAVIFDSAYRSLDPLAMLRASMVYEQIYAKLDDWQRSELTTDVMAIPGLYERIQAMSAVRRTRMAEEMAVMASGDKDAIDKYAATVFSMTDSALTAARTIAEEAQVISAGADDKTSGTMVDVSGSSREATMNRKYLSLVRAEQLFGEEGFGGEGLRDYYDTNSLPDNLKEDFANSLIAVKADNEDLPESDLTRTAEDSVKSRWMPRNWITGERIPDRYHPVHLQASFGQKNMSPNLAAGVSQWQLQREYLDKAVTSEGEPARVKLGDVAHKVAIDTQGLPFSYYITYRNGSVVGLTKDQVTGDEPAPRWAPDLSTEGLIRTANEMPPAFTLRRQIIQHLGSEWPDEKRRQREISTENFTERERDRAERAKRLPAKIRRFQRHNPAEHERRMREDEEYRAVAESLTEGG